MSRASSVRLIALGVALVALLVLPWLLPVQEPLQEFLAWTKGLGFWGPVVLAASWIPACLLAVPGTLITLAGGAIFGVPVGVVAVSLGSTAGACAAFLVGRWVARPWVERKVAGNPHFQALDRATAVQGFKIVLLLRLSPVFPFNLLNYALALTRVRFRDYALASWIGMFPGTVMYVYVGSTIGELAALSGERERSLAEWVFFFAGLALTVVATVYITRVAKRALSQALAEAGPPPEPAPVGESHV
jgi:uncharacterized membrane protein YdjX (TVP38/TMEM64 family)